MVRNAVFRRSTGSIPNSGAVLPNCVLGITVSKRRAAPCSQKNPYTNLHALL
jgi:hypothetical protein